jgi:integrase/recombinase XerD
MLSLNSMTELLLNDVMCIIQEPSTALEDIRSQLAELFSCYVIRPAPIPKGHPDLAQKIDLFLAGKRLEGLSERTLKGYLIELRVFTKYINKPTADITVVDIREYLQYFPRHKPSSIAGKISVLKSFFSWLRMEEIIDKDPMLRIKHPKKEKRLPKSLTIEELEMTREACRSSRERAILEVYYATGGRLSEVQNLNQEDIDWQAMATRVIGKGNDERSVYFSYKALYHLKKYLKSRTDNEPALFVTERRPYHRLSIRGIQREVKKISSRTGIKRSIHPHVLRHTFAQRLIDNGADLASVQALLGHKNPATTQIYCQTTDERKRQTHRQYLVQ